MTYLNKKKAKVVKTTVLTVIETDTITFDKDLKPTGESTYSAAYNKDLDDEGRFRAAAVALVALLKPYGDDDRTKILNDVSKKVSFLLGE